jgi:hypothetical protein
MDAVGRADRYTCCWRLLSEEKYTGASACVRLDYNSNPESDLSSRSNCIRTAGRIATQTPEMELLM